MSGDALLIAIVVVGLMVWLSDRRRYPNKQCWRCGGSGRQWSPLRPRAWRMCRRCDGMGSR